MKNHPDMRCMNFSGWDEAYFEGDVTSQGCWHHSLRCGFVFFDYEDSIVLDLALKASPFPCQCYSICLPNENKLRLSWCSGDATPTHGAKSSSDREFHPSVQGLHRRGRRGMYGLKLAIDLVQRAGLRDLGAVVRTGRMLSHLRRRSGHQDQDLLWRFARITWMSRGFYSGMCNLFLHRFQ